MVVLIGDLPWLLPLALGLGGEVKLTAFMVSRNAPFSSFSSFSFFSSKTATPCVHGLRFMGGNLGKVLLGVVEVVVVIGARVEEGKGDGNRDGGGTSAARLPLFFGSFCLDRIKLDRAMMTVVSLCPFGI
jgi:hypothetical protein